MDEEHNGVTTSTGAPEGMPQAQDDAADSMRPHQPSPRTQAAAHVPYQRKHATHRTQPAIDDLADDGATNESYAHDSNITIRGGALSGREYRRSRSGMPRAQSSMRYGQYLEVPKGRRAIFSSVQKKRRRNALITFIVVVIALALVAILVVRMATGQAG